jgi:amino acid adenylation domain-containing protein
MHPPLVPHSTDSGNAQTRNRQARFPPAEWTCCRQSQFISTGINSEDCIHRHFEAQALRHPEAIAIEFEGETWTYAMLDRRADQLAAALQGRGVGPDVWVGVHMERSPWMCVALLGILKAGGAYVPLDPAFPMERLKMIIGDAALGILLVDARTDGLLAGCGAGLLLVDEQAPFFKDETSVPVRSDVTSHDCAYVIYTSGSTGRPKGVEIRHRSAVNLLLSMAEAPGLGTSDSLLAVTTISFDISVAEIFLPLITGARMILAPRGVSADGESFAEMLGHHDITFAQATPTTWRLVLASGWRGKNNLRIVIGGEAVDRDLAAKLMPLCRELWNFYGPTETTVWSSCVKMEPRDGPVVIGRPLPGNEIHVLDENLQPLAIGEIGEICIGGVGVARAYAKRPDLTAEKFVPDPFSSGADATLYRTGDLGRWHPDGMLECLGRADQQVKVRGYRIELGEIESAIKDHPLIRDAVVLVHEPEAGDQRLVAYVIAEGISPAPTREQIQAHLQGRLPDYMIPSSCHAMEAFPMTPNQKIDRKELALRSPQPAPMEVMSPDSAPDPSGMPAANAIAAIWQEVLGLPALGIHDPVFKMGAHSMHVAKVHARLRVRFEKPVTVARIFQHPTPASLAAYFEETPAIPAAPSRDSRRADCRDIAIIGMSARFAGARDVDTFWHNIRHGVESIRDFSEEELLAKGVLAELLHDPQYVRRGCMLEDYENFDAGFFEMSPREAEITNPQHRVFMQGTWEALEHAGQVPQNFDGRIGLFAGAGHNNHAQVHPDLSGVEYLQCLVGNEPDYLTTRTAFKLGLNGPALNIQTACSTSLVAVHAACQALIHDQCDMAVAGGVSICWPEGKGYLYGDGLIFSKDGRCRVFDAKASGTVFSHGAGLVVLKTLDRAVADGDAIHAVIRGIAINNDGMRKGSFAAPSIEGQAEVIADALAQQAIHPESIGLMEAHGTGTSVGDPIELAGLTAAYRKWSSAKQFCAIGSVKTNIGHADAAAGAAGLIKAVMALKHREIPPSLHFEEPNPELDLERSPFHVSTTLAPWPSDRPRRAAVSSFGLGGTNAHAVLEEYPPDRLQGSAVSRAYHLLPFSAKSHAAFEGHPKKWIPFLRDHADLQLADAAFTLQLGRAAFEKRGFIVAQSAAEALARLEAGALKAESVTPCERAPVFLFTGQGAQYRGMARAVYFNEPVFSRELDRCSHLLEPLLGMSLVDALYGEGESRDFQQTALAQPALFSIAYAMAQLWMSWGVKPSCMLGHSIGEYVAATIAGVFRLEDALHLVAARGKMMQSMKPGTMLAVMHPREAVLKWLDAHPSLDLASSNAPDLCVVAGESADVENFISLLEEKGISSRLLHTSHAFHSRMMDGMLEEFTRLVATVQRQAPSIPYLSNVTGDWITPGEACDPRYYAKHIRQAVRFSEGMQRILEKPAHLFLEMGPGRTLATLAGKHLEASDNSLAIATLPGAQDDISSECFLMEALGKAWASGLKVDWSALYAEETRRRIPLPTYPFDETPYKLANRAAASAPESSMAAKQPDIADWFYSAGWRQQATLVADLQPAAWGLLGSLPDCMARLIPNAITLHASPGHEAEFDSVIRQLAKEDRLPDQILIAWTLDETPFSPDDTLLDQGIGHTLATVRALALVWSRHAGSKPLAIHFLTRGYHDVLGSESAQPQWSCLTASCLVATQEFPSIRCRHLDLPPEGADEPLARLVLAECTSPSIDPSVAWRGGRRWVRDHAAVRVPEQPRSALREEGLYLITGGLGRVGMNFAEHLASKSRARLILLGRSGPDLACSRRIAAMEAMGAKVRVVAADAGSDEEIAAAIQTAKTEFGGLHGIIHAAGIVSSQPIAGGDAADDEPVLHAKIRGTLALYRAVGSTRLDFCLLVSSLSAVLGGLGYHAYAAGNAFLDQFARWANRHSPNPWISVNWDAWRFGAQGASGIGREMYRIAMTPQESTRVLDRILQHPDASRQGWVISTVPLAPRLEQWVYGPARPRAEVTVESPPSSSDRPAIQRMQEIWKSCLRREVMPDDDYFALGGDSLMAVGLFNEIARSFGQSLPLSSLFHSPTPEKLVRLLEESRAPAPEPSSKVPDASSVRMGELPAHVIPIRQDGKLRPLFCIHGADGGVLFYRQFGLQLQVDRPFFAIEAPMLQDLRLHAGESVEAIAASYIRDIRRIQPEGPYLLGGYSFGGIVAYEMARQLAKDGIATTRLLLFDSPNPASPVRRFSLMERIRTQWNLRQDAGIIRKLAGLGMRVLCGSIFRVKLEVENRLAANTEAGERGYLRHVQSRQAHDLLYDAYVPGRYDGPTHLFIAEAGGGDKFAYQENLGWDPGLIPDLSVSEVPGSHLEIFREPFLDELLRSARAALSDED